MPFSCFQDSGSAFTEQGLDALRFFTRTKTVAIHF
jgi:aldehyde dehydrogenase (NAD+)